MSNLKDLLQCYYKYPIDFIPVFDNNNLIGIITEKTITVDINDSSKLNQELKKLIPKTISNISEKEKEDFYNKLKNIDKFPTLDIEGDIKIQTFSELEESKKKKTKRLNLNDIKFQKLIDYFHFPIFIFEVDGDILKHNESFIKFTKNWKESEIRMLVDEVLLYYTPYDDSFRKNWVKDNITYEIFAKIINNKDEQTIFIAYLLPETEKLDNDFFENNITNLNTNSQNKVKDSDIKINQESKCVNFIDIIREYDISINEYIDRVEKNIIQEVLELTDDNITLSAKILKISRSELQSKIKSADIDKTI